MLDRLAQMPQAFGFHRHTALRGIGFCPAAVAPIAIASVAVAPFTVAAVAVSRAPFAVAPRVHFGLANLFAQFAMRPLQSIERRRAIGLHALGAFFAGGFQLVADLVHFLFKLADLVVDPLSSFVFGAPPILVARPLALRLARVFSVARTIPVARPVAFARMVAFALRRRARRFVAALCLLAFPLRRLMLRFQVFDDAARGRWIGRLQPAFTDRQRRQHDCAPSNQRNSVHRNAPTLSLDRHERQPAGLGAYPATGDAIGERIRLLPFSDTHLPSWSPARRGSSIRRLAAARRAAHNTLVRTALPLSLARQASTMNAVFRAAHTLLFAAVCLGLLPAFRPVHAADEKLAPLFNGRDLTGWIPINVAPNTFTVREGMIVSTGIPTGIMRTEKQYENFILELEYRHMKAGGNAGCFVWAAPMTAPGTPFARAIEVQILDGQETKNYTSHGDIFSIHGATMKPDRPHPSGWQRCLPSEKRAKPVGEWNHYRIVCNDGVVKLSVNGKEVSGGSKCSSRKGYICLEAEGSECHFRNIKLAELPSTGATAKQTAPFAEDFRNLYTGIDLAGWQQDADHEGHWQPSDWTLKYDGKSTAADKNLWTEKAFGDYVLICDWRFTGKPVKRNVPIVLPSGDEATDTAGKVKLTEINDAGQSGIYLRGNSAAQVSIGCGPQGSGGLEKYRMDKRQPAAIRAAATPRSKADNKPGDWNRFVITVRGNRATVELNGKTVIESADLPGIAARGPIGLAHGDSTIEFASLLVKEIDDQGAAVDSKP
jgi:hypothetical protein